MATLYYAGQFATTQLSVGGGINASQTTAIVINSIPSGVDETKAGVACLTWANPLDTSTSEWITYTSINASTKEFQGVARGAEGSTGKTHLNGSTVAFVISKSHINNLIANFLAQHTEAGTHKIIQRVVTATDDATAVIDVDVTDQYQLTAIANATTISTTGTPTAGQKLIIRLKDAGVAKGLTWDGVFRAVGVTLPTTTVVSKTHYIGCIYNLTDTKWDAVAVLQEA